VLQWTHSDAAMDFASSEIDVRCVQCDVEQEEHGDLKLF
jgi:hypothetical protein